MQDSNQAKSLVKNKAIKGTNFTGSGVKQINSDQK